jgi:hypothetical protein
MLTRSGSLANCQVELLYPNDPIGGHYEHQITLHTAMLFLSMRKTSKMAATEMRMQFVEPAAMAVKSCVQLSKGDS